MNKNAYPELITIGTGADEQGYSWKQLIMLKEMIGEHFVEWYDVGTYKEQYTDVNSIIRKLIKLLQEHAVSSLVLIVDDIEEAFKEFNSNLDEPAIAINTTEYLKELEITVSKKNFPGIILSASMIQREEELDNLIAEWFLSKVKKSYKN